MFQDQYIFVYDALIEAFNSGDTIIPCSEFQEVYEEMCKVDPETEKTKLQLEFEVF